MEELDAGAGAPVRDGDAARTIRVKVSPGFSDPVVLKESATLKDLKSELERRLSDSGVCGSRWEWKFVLSGKCIGDENSAELRTLGVRDESRIMAFKKVAPPVKATSLSVAAESELQRLQRLLGMVVDRTYEHLPIMELCDANGNSVQLSEVDRKAVTIALALAQAGSDKLRNDNVNDALPLLEAAEAASRLASPRVLTEELPHIDNFALLLLDLTWAIFLSKGRDGLANRRARARLKEASDGLSTCHAYARKLRANTEEEGSPEQFVMVRLRVLQAQVEIVDGNIDRANALLAAALQLRDKLVPNEAAISQLMECGLTNAEAKEALIATGGQVAGAFSWANQQRAKRLEAQQRHREQRLVGKIRGGAGWVSLELVQQIQNLGFDRSMAAAALRQHNNDAARAIEALTDEGQITTLTLERDVFEAGGPTRFLVDQGFTRKDVKASLKMSDGDVSGALEVLRGSVCFNGSKDASTASSAGACSGHLNGSEPSSEPGRSVSCLPPHQSALPDGAHESSSGSSEPGSESDKELSDAREELRAAFGARDDEGTGYEYTQDSLRKELEVILATMEELQQ